MGPRVYQHFWKCFDITLKFLMESDSYEIVFMLSDTFVYYYVILQKCSMIRVNKPKTFGNIRLNDCFGLFVSLLGELKVLI